MKLQQRASPPPPSESARFRLLDAAEQLFADFGFNGVSTRQISDFAQVNLGAIPYYFKTKENLFKEVLLRRAAPLREERKRMLALLYERSSDPSLEEVLWALLEPAFRTNKENQHFRKLLGRSSMDPTPEVRRLLAEIYTLDFMTVPHVLRQCFSKMNDEEFFWKLNCFYGAFMFIQADTGKIQTIAGADFVTSEPAIALKYVIPFLAAGFRTSAEYKAPHSIMHVDAN